MEVFIAAAGGDTFYFPFKQMEYYIYKDIMEQNTQTNRTYIEYISIYDKPKKLETKGHN